MKAKDIEVGKFYKVKVLGKEVIAIVESVKKGNYVCNFNDNNGGQTKLIIGSEYFKHEVTINQK